MGSGHFPEEICTAVHQAGLTLEHSSRCCFATLRAPSPWQGVQEHWAKAAAAAKSLYQIFCLSLREKGPVLKQWEG